MVVCERYGCFGQYIVRLCLELRAVSVYDMLISDHVRDSRTIVVLPSRTVDLHLTHYLVATRKTGEDYISICERWSRIGSEIRRVHDSKPRTAEVVESLSRNLVTSHCRSCQVCRQPNKGHHLIARDSSISPPITSSHLGCNTSA